MDEKKAAVYLPLLPVSFVEHLQANGFTLIPIPEKEFDSMGPNILALRPGMRKGRMMQIVNFCDKVWC